MYLFPNKADASEKSSTDVLSDMGYTGFTDRSDYNYHYIYLGRWSGYLHHVYSDTPITIRSFVVNGYYNILLNDFNVDYYSVSNKNYISTTTTSSSQAFNLIFMSDVKNGSNSEIANEINNFDWGSTIKFISGNIGISVSNDSMVDIGYKKGSVFFFQGDFTSEDANNPLQDSNGNSGSTGPSNDDYDGWFAGLAQSFSNIINGLKEGISDIMTSLGQFILDGLSALFLPDADFINTKIDIIKEKFSFVTSVKDMFDDIVSMISQAGDPPVISIDLTSIDSKYNFGSSVNINFDWYVKYKPQVDKIIIGFAYIGYVFLLYKRLPSIITGAGAITSRVQDKGE